MNRLLANICSDNVVNTAKFYQQLFAMEIDFESDWYMHLIEPTNKSLELGIIDRNYNLVPRQYSGSANGMYLTFVVDDVQKYFTRAKTMSCQILQEPEPTFYGQHRMLLIDPDGVLIDISSLLETN